ncbi:MAG: PIN domain-containing protein [Gemmatimonadales bacterium]
MSRGIFLDTAGWFAALNPRDPDHAVARRAYQEWITVARRRMVTTNLVVAEMHVLLARRLGIPTGVAFLDGLATDPLHNVITVDRELEREAVDRWLRPFLDQPFSLTDAVSFEVMRRERVTEAFTFDRHFEVAGYRRVP